MARRHRHYVSAISPEELFSLFPVRNTLITIIYIYYAVMPFRGVKPAIPRYKVNGAMDGREKSIAADVPAG